MSSQQYRQPSRRVSKVRQACDCCHNRKIRCDGMNPCANCLSTELQCTYFAVPKKKGPKGRRVLKSLRTGKIPSIGHPFPIPQNPRPTGSGQPPTGNHNVDTEQRELPNIDDIPGRRGVPGFQISPLVSIEMITRCLDTFFTHKYPITPILDLEQTYASLPHLGSFPEQYGLITACCSVIVLSPEILAPSPSLSASSSGNREEEMPTSEFLISETIRARQFCNYSETPTLPTIHTSFFLFAALFCIGKDNSAWYYIREAMTMLQLLRLHEETTYSSLPSSQEAIFSRRTFWLLFVTERAYALQRHRPLTLQRTIALPTVDPTGPEAHILSGFLDLVSLFQNFDDGFLALWNLPSTPLSASPASVIRLQDILNFAIPNVSERTEIQQADLLISRQWLKAMVWQLCVSRGLLSSLRRDESMSFYYPITIARNVVLIFQLLPPQAFEANGVGILEKVFDIGCSLADVLLLKSNFMQSSALEVGPRDYLVELVGILGTVSGGSSKYLRLLASKADECLQVQVRDTLLGSEDPHEIYELKDDEDIEEEDIMLGTWFQAAYGG